MPSLRRLASAPRMTWWRERPCVVGPVAHRQPHLGGEEHVVAARAQRLADDLLADALGVGVGGVDQVHARVAGHADLPLRRVDVELADGLRPTPAAVAHGAQRDRRDEQARPSQLPILHAYDLSCPPGSVPPAPCSTPTRSSRPRGARSARTSASTSAGTASGGRPPRTSPATTPARCARRSPTCSGSASPRRSGSGSAPCSCARRTATCCGTAVPLLDDAARDAIAAAGGIDTDLHLPPALLRRPRRHRRRLRRPRAAPARRRAVDPAPLRPARAVRRPRRRAARRDARPHRRPLRRRRGAALGGGLGGARRTADRRHHHGGAGPRVGELHVELPEPHPARPGHHPHASSSGSPRSRSTASTAAGGAAWWSPTAPARSAARPSATSPASPA